MNSRRAFRIHLLERHIGFHHQFRRMGIGQRHHRSAAQPPVAAGVFVVAVGKAEAVLRPGQQIHAIANGIQQYDGTLQPRQVEIAREILDQLFHRDMFAAPEWYSVQFHAQSGRGKAGQVELIGTQLLAGAHRQRIGPG